VNKPLKSVRHGRRYARPTVTFPAVEHRCLVTGTIFYCWVKVRHPNYYSTSTHISGTKFPGAAAPPVYYLQRCLESTNDCGYGLISDLFRLISQKCMQTCGHLVMKCSRAVTATITRVHKAAGSGTASIDAEFSCEISRDPL